MSFVVLDNNASSIHFVHFSFLKNVFIDPGNDFCRRLRAPRVDLAGDARMINKIHYATVPVFIGALLLSRRMHSFSYLRKARRHIEGQN